MLKGFAGEIFVSLLHYSSYLLQSRSGKCYTVYCVTLTIKKKQADFYRDSTLANVCKRETESDGLKLYTSYGLSALSCLFSGWLEDYRTGGRNVDRLSSTCASVQYYSVCVCCCVNSLWGFLVVAITTSQRVWINSELPWRATQTHTLIRTQWLVCMLPRVRAPQQTVSDYREQHRRTVAMLTQENEMCFDRRSELNRIRKAGSGWETLQPNWVCWLVFGDQLSLWLSVKRVNLHAPQQVLFHGVNNRKAS